MRVTTPLERLIDVHELCLTLALLLCKALFTEYGTTSSVCLQLLCVKLARCCNSATSRAVADPSIVSTWEVEIRHSPDCMS